jgi:cell wall-associated NlpC family hydrolase
MRTAVRLPLLVLTLLTALIAGLLVMTHVAAAQPGTPAAAPAAAPAGLPAPFVVVDTSVAEAQAEAARQARAARAARAAKVARVQQLRERIVTVARKQIGDRYSAGSSGPHAFDCSGLTRYVYKVATGKELPHYSRAQYSKVKKISRKNAKPGDLVFFFRNGAHHVGIYIGKGRMIDAPGYGKPVRVSPISGSWWGRTYSGMGRLLPA